MLQSGGLSLLLVLTVRGTPKAPVKLVQVQVALRLHRVLRLALHRALRLALHLQVQAAVKLLLIAVRFTLVATR